MMGLDALGQTLEKDVTFAVSSELSPQSVGVPNTGAPSLTGNLTAVVAGVVALLFGVKVVVAKLER